MLCAVALAECMVAIGCANGQPATSVKQSGGPPGTVTGFLRTYVMPDGRISRPDQGGDTVSEGQAYGMLLAEVAGDDAAFGQIWRWTRTHLQQPDGLFAYHAAASGRVLSTQPASDADLLIAWALLRYGGAGSAAMHADGRRVASAILAREVTTGPGGRPVLTAGPWATGRPASLDPSYWSLPAMHALAAMTGDAKWQELADAVVPLTAQITSDGRLLPPDWVALSASGSLRPEPAPSGAQPQTQYGLDAQRLVVWLAAGCDAQGRALAARWWGTLRQAGRTQAIALSPGGAVLDAAPSPVPIVASAAAATAAGDPQARTQLLAWADDQQRREPTYYGGAWTALAQALLSRNALSAC